MADWVFADWMDQHRLDEARRCELGVEALCELVCDAVRVLENGSHELSADFMERFSGISMAARGEEAPADLRARTHSVRVSKLLWMCLSRVLDLTRHLAQTHPRAAQWQEVHDKVEAWIHSWGNDARSRHAQARFSTLTGLVRGKESQVDFMYAALIESLSVVEA